MVAKKRLGAAAKKALAQRGTFKVDGDTHVISAAVWGQLEPLNRVAREKTGHIEFPNFIHSEQAARLLGARF